ncbi:MAG: hydrogenase small subunit [Candidatus Bathyarchaeia archaeon]
MSLSRRNFMKAGVGAAVMFSTFRLDDAIVKEAMAQLLGRSVSILWLHGAACQSCTISLLNTTYPDVVDVILGTFPEVKMDFDFQTVVMPDWGDRAVEQLKNPPKDYILLVEGSIQTKNDGAFCTVGEMEGRPVTMKDWVMRLAKDAMAVVAIGTCASYGGIPAGFPNPTGAMGTNDFLGAHYASRLNLPIVNVPGCPPHPDWMVGTLASVILAAKKLSPFPELDSLGRPTMFFGKSVHDDCPRRGQYDEGAFAERFGYDGCVYQLGCKGPISYADCNSRKWNNGLNSCTISGAPCLACVQPEFPDRSSPFFEPLPVPPLSLKEAAGIGAVVGGILAGAHWIHGRKRKNRGGKK